MGNQHAVESVIDSQMRKLDAEEILVAVMDSKSGKILAMATSDRFNPSRIRKRDMGALNPDFTEYLYEPGSVIKPLTLAIALEHKKVICIERYPLWGGKIIRG